MRVLIVGINYRPERTAVGPYTAGLAEHLAARGDEVTVITGLPHYPAWQIARGTPRALLRRETIRGRHGHPRGAPRGRICREAGPAGRVRLQSPGG